MSIETLVPFAIFGLTTFGVMFLFSVRNQIQVEESTAWIPQSGSQAFRWGICIALALSAICWVAGVGPVFVVAPNPRALFEESRLGITRSDIRDQLRGMERHVPDTLRDMESRLPQYSADLEREMMNNANKYGLSPAEIRAQMREIESQAREQIRGMDGDVRRQIRDLEEPTWEELRRIERGR